MPASPITFADLPNRGWGEPPCGHTSATSGCETCLWWRYQPADIRAGSAYATHLNTPWVYRTMDPAAVAAAMARLDQVRRRTVPGGMHPTFGAPPRRRPPTPRPTWAVTATAGAFGESRAESVPPPRRPAPEAAPPKSDKPLGPGGHLYAMYAAWGLPHCSACAKLAARMDDWGPPRCREHLDEIVADIKKRKNILKLIRAVTRAVLTGKVNRDALKMPLTIRGQVLEAIRRAEAQP